MKKIEKNRRKITFSIVKNIFFKSQKNAEIFAQEHSEGIQNMAVAGRYLNLVSSHILKQTGELRVRGLLTRYHNLVKFCI